MDMAIKHIRELIQFFREVRIFSFENCCNIVKKISAGLEIKFKDHHIQQKRTLFSYEA